MPKEYLFDADEMKGNQYASPFIAPVATPKTTIASELAGIAKDTVEGVQGARLRNDLENEQDQFITNQQVVPQDEADEFASEESDFDAANSPEYAMVDQAKKEVNKLNAARQQGRISATAFKAKVEATMKGYINQTPGLGTELRKVASDVLGFDPNGSALKSALIAADATTASRTKQLDHMGNLLETAGYSDPSLSRVDNIAKYWMTFSKDKLGEAAAVQGLTELERDGKLGAIAQKSVLRDSMNGTMMNTINLMKSVLQLPDITPETLRGMSPDEKANAIANVQNAKTAFLNEQVGRYSELKPEEIEKAMVGPIKYMDDTIAWLDGKLEADLYTNSYNSNLFRAKNGIVSDPATAKIIALTQTFSAGNIASPSTRLVLEQTYQQLLSGLSTAAQTNGNTNPESSVISAVLAGGGSEEDARVTANAARRDLVDTWKKNQDKMSPQENIDFYNLMVGYTRDIHSYPTEVKTEVIDSVFEMSADPKFVNWINKPENQDGRLVQNLGATAGIYTKRVFDSMNAELQEKAGRDFKVVLDPTSGSMRFAPTDASTDAQASNGILKRNASFQLQKMNDTYALRLNNLVKSVSHMSGHKNYASTAVQLLSKGLLKYVGSELDDGTAELLNK